MRELKFRAWHKENKAMYDSDITMTTVLSRWITNTMNIQEDYELMQYTWLKDKNWKEIYEGDIIQVWSLNWIVKYVAWKYVIVDKKDLHITDLYNSWHLFNIIGNAYKNPELLNK